MPLEATMIIVDNSEYMRNGDFTPSRFSAQSDAVSVIFGAKTQSNPENTVGVMSMAGKTPEVLVTPTQDIGKILSAMHTLKISGEADVSTGIQIAQLALKHRQNKNQRQRIVAFVGSPLAIDEKALVRLGKKLKKNNVSIDIISFGEGEENDDRLRAFVDAVSSSDNSHLVSIPPGPHLLSDMIVSSPILAGDSGAGDGPSDIPGGSGGGEGFEFGVDPSLDPELAMALRMSMQEEQARQDAAAAAANSE
ncbi:19S proteasome regulatory subunit Rpn10, partial [Clavulina sp. PMI_390]